MNNRSVDRRAFLGRASGLAAAGCLGLTGLRDMAGIVSGLRPGAHEVLKIASRPFNMLAFGDSIMWGQGLTEGLKFGSLVKSWVEASLPGRSVTFQSFAHSGAVILPDAQQDAAGVFGGEVPSSYPSIHGQLARALDTFATRGITAAEIDLVLLNGGINDIGVVNILNPIASTNSVSELTRDSITDRMNYLLPTAAGLFPNAKFIVPGYFPIITPESSVFEITALLVALGLGEPLTALGVTAALKQTLVDHCGAFFAESDAGLRGAVIAQNGRTPNRCVYADPGFSAVNGYGAPQRFLFNVGENDPMNGARQAQCAAAGEATVSKCTIASMGHPNANGAAKYANAMTAKLGAFLPEWQGLRRLFACVDPKPVIGGAASYTVWVEDAETRLPVPASVTVGEQIVSANSKFTHAFGCAAPETETLDGARGKPGRTVTLPPVCDQIMISAPGYINLAVRYPTV